MTTPAGTDSATLAQKNRKYWDGASQSVFKSQWVAELQETIAEFLLDPQNDGWIGLPDPSNRSSKMLDYACGDGLPSRTLKSRIGSCIGVDVSAGMLEKYNENARRLGLGPDEMTGVRGDLFAEPSEATEPVLPAERLQNFDLVVICMALHHMEDIELAVARLAARVRPGGTLLVIDWARIDGSTPAQKAFLEAKARGEIHHVMPTNGEDGHQHQHHHHHDHSRQGKSADQQGEVHRSHPASHTISHDSFTEQQMTDLFAGGGCGEVRWKLANQLSNVPGARSGKMQLFWARATKLGGGEA